MILITCNQWAYCQKNTIKGSIIFTPLIKIYFGSLSLGYERLITDNQSVSLTLNIWIAEIEGDNEFGYSNNNDGYGLINLLIEFKNYVRKDEEGKILNNCYSSIYSIISSEQSSINGGCKGKNDGYQYSGKHLGLGVAVGKQFYLTKNKKLVFDIGAGSALTYFLYSSYISGPYCSRVDKKPELKWLPRVIFLIGYNF